MFYAAVQSVILILLLFTEVQGSVYHTLGQLNNWREISTSLSGMDNTVRLSMETNLLNFNAMQYTPVGINGQNIIYLSFICFSFGEVPLCERQWVCFA